MEERDLFSESMEDLMDKIEKGELPSIADEKLAQGYSVTYSDQRWPDKIIREYPDGRKEFIDFDEDYNEVVIGKPVDCQARPVPALTRKPNPQD